jgi:transglutaminase-like putative cysteine protease
MPFGFRANEAYMNDVFANRQIDPVAAMEQNTQDTYNGSSFDIDEQSYREFVYDNYLNVSREFINNNPVLDENYMAYITAESVQFGKSTLTGSEVFVRKLNYIQNWLRDNCEYEIKVDPLPPGEDFSLYFLNTSRKGFCQHFATSAVLLCRAAGIPARYVTGFIISPSDYSTPLVDGDGAADSITDRVVEVTDNRAHAWIEVYVDRVGWIPMDFTSGYGNVRTALSSSQRAERNEINNNNTNGINVTYEPATPEQATPEPEIPVPETPATPVTPPAANPDNNAATPIPPSGIPKPARIAIIIFAAILAIAAVVVFMVQRRKNALRKPPKSFSEIAGISMRVLKMGGIPAANVLADTGAYMRKLSKSDYSAATPIVKNIIKVEYGHITPTQEDVSDCQTRLKDIILIYYRKQKLFKRLYLKYILNLL